MAAAAAAPRCPSDLPDDLILRILFLAPARDAACAAVLSRRWRSLWLASGAVYLDSSSFHRADQWEPNNNERECFIRSAEKALATAAAAVPIRKLTFVVKSDIPAIYPTPNISESELDLIDPVVSMPAARRVEELHVQVDDWCRRPLGFGSLPSEALHVLSLVNCRLIAGPTAFPCLAELHLRNCIASLVVLQGIVNAAPQLATLHLESSCLSEKEEEFYHMPPVKGPRCNRLVCPAVTSLVFVDCSRLYSDVEAILELDVPRLQSISYKGALPLSGWLSLMMPSTMIQADLHVVQDYHVRDDVPMRTLFWQFVKNFYAAKLLKLKLDFSMDSITFVGAENQNELLCGHDMLFRNLERLEIDMRYNPASEASMAVLATLLHICPVVRDLRIKLSKDISWMHHFSIDQAARADFDMSVHRFRHCRSPVTSSGGEDYYDSYVALQDMLPMLSNKSFSCLQSNLRRVSLRFCMEEPNCLGVQLAKFFAQEAMVLEEMYVDDGSQKMRWHVNASVGRWMANSAETRDMGDNIWS